MGVRDSRPVAVVLALFGCGAAASSAVTVDPTAGFVVYRGGGVLSQPEVFVVFWGSDVPAEVRQTAAATYQGISEVDDFDWIDEYDTPTQHISRSSFVGSAVIEPLDAGTELSDDDISAELARQIDTGLLPRLGENAYYPVYLPSGVSVRLNGALSCEVWLAYHRPLAPEGLGTYAVFPECKQHFSLSPAAVHELFETITDPRGDGWNTQVEREEIADLCQGARATVRLADAGFLDIQRLWSNRFSNCLGSPHEFFLGVNPVVAVARDGLAFNVGMSPPPRQPYARLSWRLSGLPAGASYSVDPVPNLPNHWVLNLHLRQPFEPAQLTLEAESEAWISSALLTLTLDSSAHVQPSGCSQATGDSWPLGVLTLLVLPAVRGRSRPGRGRRYRAVAENWRGP